MSEESNSGSLSYTLESFDGDFGGFVEKFHDYCQAYDIDPAEVFSLEVSLEELIVNSFNYGNSPFVKLEVSLGDDELTVVMTDSAPPFDLLHEAPDIPTGELKERKIGGLGIHLVRELTDRLEYSHTGDGNRITLVKSVGGDG